MATTLTRTKSNSKPEYKDYVSFLDSYRNGGGAAASTRKDDQISVDSGFPLSNTTSSSSLSNGAADVTDFAKSYEHFRENSKNKKFTPVRPNLDDLPTGKKKQVKKSEIFIEIKNDNEELQHAKKVSEVSKMFEKNIRLENSKNSRKAPVSGKLGNKINMFEKPAEEKQKARALKSPPALLVPPPLEFSEGDGHPPPPLEFSNSYGTRVHSPPPMVSSPLPPPPAMFERQLEQKPRIAEKPMSPPPPPMSPTPPPPPPMSPLPPPMSPPPPPPPPMSGFVIPPPPQFAGTHTQKIVSNSAKGISHNNGASSVNDQKNGLSVINGHQKNGSMHGQQKNGAASSTNGTGTGNGPNFNKNGIDMNDPMVKKMVYGTLRGMYGAQHQKANGIVATLPRDRVKKDNNIQNIIEAIASNGGLDKIKGRANPKVDADQN